MNAPIVVYADWQTLSEPLRIGILYPRKGNVKEIFQFEFDPAALDSLSENRVRLDPRLQLVAGRQYPPADRATFGMLSDASCDRWGRKLMDRRHAYVIRQGDAPVLPVTF